MTKADSLTPLERLSAVLNECGTAAIAVSGGVDSMTLASVAHHLRGRAATMVHAVSPAVPSAATERVRTYAEREGWALQVIDAGEFEDERYLENPANRCFYCKTNLYDAIAAKTGLQMLSGTNLDDLSDRRPGLQAAQAHGVRHPFVEARIDKAGVRQLARDRGLDISELPASPCLSSRVETGIRIVPDRLLFIDAAEELVRRSLVPSVVRCRIRAGGIVIELDDATRSALSPEREQGLAKDLAGLYAARAGTDAPPVRFDTYRMGGAFLWSAA